MSHKISLKYVESQGLGTAGVWYKIDGDKVESIGGPGGFAMILKNPSLAEYSLFSPFNTSGRERFDVILLRRDWSSIQLLGRVRLDAPRISEWATNLINQDLEKLEKTGTTEKSSETLQTPSKVGLTPEGMAEGVLYQVEEIARNGLNKVYESHKDFSYDMFADLPWDERGSEKALKWLVEQPRLKTASDTIVARGGPDYYTMFKNSLENNDGHGQIDPRWSTRN